MGTPPLPSADMAITGCLLQITFVHCLAMFDHCLTLFVRVAYRVTRSQNEVESLSTQLEQIETKATQSAKSSTTLEANLAEAQGRSGGPRPAALLSG